MFVFFGFALANAQDLPFLYKVNVTTKVCLSNTQGYYNFYYNIENTSQNKGSVGSFGVDISRDTASLDLDTIGLVFARPSMVKNFNHMYPVIKQRIVPFSFFSLPRYWDAELGGITSAFAFPDTLFILPGQAVGGIAIMSRGLPSIRSFVVEPEFNDDAYYGDQTPSPEVQDSIRNIINYYGTTLGPQSPPKNFIPTAWCDTISSYISQSQMLSWIHNQTTENKYLGYFTTTKAQLQDNNIAAACTTLQTVLNNANADSTSKLSSEAYALIRYNAEYLMMQLSIPPIK
jgi:hypothetical protein